MILAEYILDGPTRTLEPRPDSEIWEWAEANIVLSDRVTPFPGPLSFDRSPYMVGEWSPLWAYKRYECVDLVFASQTGKTLMMQVTVGYDADVQPGPGMIVYPTHVVAKRRSKKHILPFLEDSLPHLFTGQRYDVNTLEYHLKTCDIVLGWAGSPAVLAAEPIKYLKCDEEAKFDEGDDREADSKALAMKRMRQYRPFATCFSATTPARPIDPGWVEWERSTKCQRCVPCWKCGEFQVMYFNQEDRDWLIPEDKGTEFRGGIKWDRDPGLSFDERCQSAYYECAHCGAHWNDRQKNDADQHGEWRPQHPHARNYAAHLPSWYARVVTLEFVVRQWLTAYRTPKGRQDFDNSERAIPWEPPAQKIEESWIAKHKLPGHRAGEVPIDADALFLTADVMDDHIRYRVRAWKSDGTSWGVDGGSLTPRLDDLMPVLGRTYPQGMGKIGIAYGLIDARWRKDEVLQFCLASSQRMWPAMGHDNLREVWHPRKVAVIPDPEKGFFLQGELIRIDYQDDRWKDMLLGRLAIKAGDPGAWHIEEDISAEYLHQMTGEVKRDEMDRRGRTRKVWATIHPNHDFDCEKLQLLATVVFQLSAMQAHTTETTAGPIINPYTGQVVQ